MSNTQIPAGRQLWAVIEDYSGEHRRTYGPDPVIGWTAEGVVLADQGGRSELHRAHNGRDRGIRVHYRETRAEGVALQREIIEVWTENPAQ